MMISQIDDNQMLDWYLRTFLPGKETGDRRIHLNLGGSFMLSASAFRDIDTDGCSNLHAHSRALSKLGSCARLLSCSDGVLAEMP